MRGSPSPALFLPCPFARRTRCDEVLVVQATGSVGDRSGHAALDPGVICALVGLGGMQPPRSFEWSETRGICQPRRADHRPDLDGDRKRPGRRPGDSSQTLTSPALLRAIVLGPRPVTCLRKRGGCCRSRPVGRALGLIDLVPSPGTTEWADESLPDLTVNPSRVFHPPRASA